METWSIACSTGLQHNIATGYTFSTYRRPGNTSLGLSSASFGQAYLAVLGLQRLFHMVACFCGLEEKGSEQ